MPSHCDLILFEAQGFACSDAKLFFDYIYAGNHFGYGVFHLQARIHFDEIEFPILIQELEGTGTLIADVFACLDAARAEISALLGGDTGRGRFFEHFLMATLHRAVTLHQVYDIAVTVAQNLKFDVTRVFEKFLKINRVITKSG